MYLIRKINDKNYKITSIDGEKQTLIGYADSPETAEKLCENYAGTDWGWENEQNNERQEINMVLYTNDGKTYEVKWVEFWNEREMFFLAETKDGEELKIELENFNKVEEGVKLW